jgi:hypothetical protein
MTLAILSGGRPRLSPSSNRAMPSLNVSMRPLNASSPDPKPNASMLSAIDIASLAEAQNPVEKEVSIVSLPIRAVEDPVKPGHQESVFMELLLRIQALERTANASEFYINKLSTSHARLNQSQSTLSSDVTTSIAALHEEIYLVVNNSWTVSSHHLPLLSALLNTTQQLEMRLEILSDSQSLLDTRLNSLCIAMALIVVLVGFLVLMVGVLLFRTR